MAGAGGGDDNMLHLFSRDILRYEKLIRERGTTWEKVMKSIELDATNLLHSEGDGPLIQILNCRPTWKELFSAQRKLDVTFCDVHLITEEGYIPVHSVFLRGLSPFLDSLLENVNSVSCKYDVLSISLPDIKMAHLKAFLTLIYCGSVGLSSEEDEKDVRNVMKLLQIGEMSLERVPNDSEDNRRRNKFVRGYRHEISKDERYYGKTKSAEAQTLVKTRCSKPPSVQNFDVQVAPVPGPSSSKGIPNRIQPAVAKMSNNQSMQSDNECVPKRRTKSRPIRTIKQALNAYVYLERMDDEKIQRLIAIRKKSRESNPALPKDMPHSQLNSGFKIKTKKSHSHASKSHSMQNFCSVKRKIKKTEDSSAAKPKSPRKWTDITSGTSLFPSCGKPKEPTKLDNEKCIPSGTQNPFDVRNLGLDFMMKEIKKAGSQPQPTVPCNKTININQIIELDPVTVTKQQDSNNTSVFSIVNIAASPSSEQIPKNIPEIVPEAQLTRDPTELGQNQIRDNFGGPNNTDNDNSDMKNETIFDPMPIPTFHPEPPIADDDECPISRKEVDIIVLAETILDKSSSAANSPADAISTGSILTSVQPADPDPPSPITQAPEKEKDMEVKESPPVDPEVKELNDQPLQHNRPPSLLHLSIPKPPNSPVPDTNANQRKEFRTAATHRPRRHHPHERHRPFTLNQTYHHPPSSHQYYYQQPQQLQQLPIPLFGNTGQLPQSQLTFPFFNWASNYPSNPLDTFENPFFPFTVHR